MNPGHVTVVGSGPSGVHFALSALRRGFNVTMVDVGRRAPAPVLRETGFEQLKDELDDPAQYFLGDRLEGLVIPSAQRKFYEFPPSKSYVFHPPEGFDFTTEGFDPLFSFATGGLAEAWTAGCYPFNDAELELFPFSYAELAPYYQEIAGRIGVTGEGDDLAQFMPVHEDLLPPLSLDPHSALLLQTYERRKARINKLLKAYVGRTRVATLSVAKDGRKACDYLGRCLWGCPTGALYTPSLSMRVLERHPAFSYVPGVEALYFRMNAQGRIDTLVGRRTADGELIELPISRLVLAAGTLASATLVMRSVRTATGEDLTLPGLMDNRQALVPFLNLRMLGRGVPTSSYQYHLLGMGLAGAVKAEYVHCQITTLKTAMVHPIVQGLPFDLRTSLAITVATRSALGVVNVNLHDTRRPENTVTLDTSRGLDSSQLRIRYSAPVDEPARLADALGRVRKVLGALNCVVPPGQQQIRPMGASVHYAGTFPMSDAGGRWTTTPGGQSRAFENLYFADGSTFPFLPAKNLTFTLMANAARVADSMPDA